MSWHNYNQASENLWQKALKPWEKKLKKISEDGITSHFHRSLGVREWEWPSSLKQYIDSGQSPPQFQQNVLQILKGQISGSYGNTWNTSIVCVFQSALGDTKEPISVFFPGEDHLSQSIDKIRAKNMREETL